MDEILALGGSYIMGQINPEGDTKILPFVIEDVVERPPSGSATGKKK
jgi:hypothetical protein